MLMILRMTNELMSTYLIWGQLRKIQANDMTVTIQHQSGYTKFKNGPCQWLKIEYFTCTHTLTIIDEVLQTKEHTCKRLKNCTSAPRLHLGQQFDIFPIGRGKIFTSCSIESFK